MTDGLDKELPRGFDTYEVTLGDQMRGERATLGKSLLDVQRDLRIKATYIAAIENCDPSVFPTQGFIAGYVRSYSRYLDMDPDECFIRFCEESGFGGVHPDLNAAPRKSAKPAVLVAAPRSTPALDPLARPRIPNVPQAPGLLSHLSPSAIGSLVVLAAIVVGIGYGGLAVLKEVQRVQFVPVNQTPGVTAEVATLSEDAASQRDNVVGLRPTASVRQANLDQLYRPQELELPELVQRDAPIASLSAGSIGAYANLDVAAPQALPKPEEPQPPRVIAQGPPPVDVVALKPAWVRVYFDDGSVMFEKILDAGESYRIPAEVEGAQLRAGNAGAVFVKVGEATYGPVGRPGGVVKNVALNGTAVASNFSTATDVFEGPLDPPLNLDDLLKRENAIVSIEQPAPAE